MSQSSYFHCRSDGEEEESESDGSNADSEAFRNKPVSKHTQQWIDELAPAQGVQQQGSAPRASHGKPASPDEVSESSAGKRDHASKRHSASHQRPVPNKGSNDGDEKEAQSKPPHARSATSAPGAGTVEQAGPVSGISTITTIERRDDEQSVADSGLDGSGTELQDMHASITTDYEKAKRLRRLLRILGSPRSQQSLQRLKKLTMIIVAFLMALHVAEYVVIQNTSQQFNLFVMASCL